MFHCYCYIFFHLVYRRSLITIFSLCIQQRLNIQHERNKLRADKEELEIMKEDLAQERRQLHTQQQQLSTERHQLSAERKAFHDTKYNFLLDNAILPEWREEEIRKLIMFDLLIDANKHLNIFYANKK